MAKRSKASEPSEPEHELGIVKVDDSPAHAKVEMNSIPEQPPPPPPSATVAAPSGPSFGERVGRFFRFLLRLVLLLIVLSLLGIALYILIPELYQRYIRPLERNTADVQELRSRLEESEQQLADLQTRLETNETVQNEDEQSLNDLDERLSDIETEINARTESLTALEEMQAETQEKNEAASAELQREIEVLKAMELLSRARLFMYQSNFGLAQQDIKIARDVLSEVQPDAPDARAEELDIVILRLDMTLSNLPDFPVAASDDLDIAWQILLSGLPQVTPTLSETLTPASTQSITLEATTTLTPQVTVQPSATP